jgi:hypothetical protein
MTTWDKCEEINQVDFLLLLLGSKYNTQDQTIKAMDTDLQNLEV